MPRGGDLRIGLTSLMVERGKERPLPQMGAGRWVRLDVTDTGNGIPPEVQPHVFDPFFTTKQAGMRSGLGLPQVYGIVKQSGGLESEIGLPTGAGRGPSQSAVVAPRSGGLHRLRVIPSSARSAAPADMPS
jgi:two-component system, cell cycle sensor histidine kinase and response regulator CckA